jgi:hypothetical protein
MSIFAPPGVHRGPASPKHARVHHVVVEKAGGMDQLRSDRHRYQVLGRRIAGIAEEPDHHRSRSLTASAHAEVPCRAHQGIAVRGGGIRCVCQGDVEHSLYVPEEAAQVDPQLHALFI